VTATLTALRAAAEALAADADAAALGLRAV
jgi:hypothetical protein